MDRMFAESIRQGKAQPDFSGTDQYQVSLVLHGEVQDTNFLRFLEKVGQENLAAFAVKDLLVLDCLRREQRVPEALRPRLAHLAEQEVIEAIGRGRGRRYILSRRFYAFLGKEGVYTRKRGLDRETNKALLEKHIRDNKRTGSRLKELMQVLPALSRGQIQSLLRELRAEERVRLVGKTRAARWYPASRV